MKYSIWFVLTVFVFISCGDETPEKTEYKDGVVIVNQGPFMTGTGTLTFQDKGEGLPVQNIYSNNNDEAFLGNIAQSMFMQDDKNYIAVNNAGKIVVTDKDDFTFIDTISGINQARFFAGNGDKLFVSSWGADGISGAVHEINTSNNSIERSYALGNGPEGMVMVDNLLYVAKGGGFGLDSTVVVIDTDANEIVNTIVVGDNPEQIVKTSDDVVIVICNGYTDFLEPANNTSGSLVKIQAGSVIETTELPNGSNRLAIDTENNEIYFNLFGNVVKMNASFSGLMTENVKEGSGFALGFDNEDGLLYVTDAKDFSSLGEVSVIDRDVNLVRTFQAGIVPGYIHFQ